ncbi:MAG: divalent-cation tolerance protein CutA [Alphaproteobacteria bacterium]|nr:MAG: divalent-cation tolerance protein CutA [Alphaproteobacteria bacterium]
MFEQYDDHTFEFVYVTFPNLTEATRVAQDVIANNLAACVNIIPGVLSIFRDGDSIQKKPEAIFVAKTRAEIRSILQEYIIANHPYAVPSLVVLPIRDGHPDFFEWIIQKTGDASIKESN